MMKRNKIIAAILTVSMSLTMIASLPGELFLPENTLAVQAAETAQGISVAYRTQEEIRAYVKENGATTNDALSFAEEPVTTSPYALGRLSDETLQSALAMINQIRYIAGLSDNVALDDGYTEKVQAAALVNYVNNKLSHTPTQPSDMSDEMYQLGSQGAGSSNIAWASWKNRSLNETIVKSWMHDGNAGNIPMIGHRRWILNPTMGKIGFGAVSGTNGTYSAMYSFDRSNSSAGEYGVLWPAQNMPVEYFGSDYPWSVSMGSRVTASDITVTLTRIGDGKVWNFSATSADGYFNVNNDGYGQTGCIIFRPDDLTGYSDGDSFAVEVNGLSGGTVSYTVDFFTLQEGLSETTGKPSVEPSAPTSSGKPSVEPSAPTSSGDPSAQPSTSAPNGTSSAEPSSSAPAPTNNSSTEPWVSTEPKPSAPVGISSASPEVSPTASAGTSSARPSTTPGATASARPSTTPRTTVTPSVSPKPTDSGAGVVRKPSKPRRAKLTKAKSKSRGCISVKWKKISGCDGYQVQSSLSRRHTGKKYTTRALGGTFTGLKSRRIYYVRVRAYKYGNSANNYKVVYGKWSKVKKVKVR